MCEYSSVSVMLQCDCSSMNAIPYVCECCSVSVMLSCESSGVTCSSRHSSASARNAKIASEVGFCPFAIQPERHCFMSCVAFGSVVFKSRFSLLRAN